MRFFPRLATSCLPLLTLVSLPVEPLRAASQGTLLVSRSLTGQPGNGRSARARVSTDGRWVVYQSASSDLVPGDNNGAYDIFVLDRTAGTTERVSLTHTGVEATDNSEQPAISPRGRWVAFVSSASDLVPGDTNAVRDIFVRDRQNGTTRRISVDSNGGQGNGRDTRPRIAAGGRFVFFESRSTNLVPNDANGTQDIFVRDRDPDGNGIYDEGNGITTRLSISSSGVASNSDCFFPSVTLDGRFVSYHTHASTLVPGDTNGTWDVFLHDRDPDGNGIFDEGNGVTTRVSETSAGVELPESSRDGDLSPDGAYIAFWSESPDLVPNDTNGVGDIFVSLLSTSSLVRVSVATGGLEANGESLVPSMTLHGRFVAFHSTASNLALNDANSVRDIFLHDRDPDGNGVLDEGNGTTERISLGPLATQADGQSRIPRISGNGRWVSFESEAQNLAPGDSNGTYDTFVRDLLKLEMVSTGAPPTSRLRVTRAFGDEGREVFPLASCTGSTPGFTLSGGVPVALRFDSWTRWSIARNPQLSILIGPDGMGLSAPFSLPALTGLPSGSLLYLSAGLRLPGSPNFLSSTDTITVDIP